MAPSPVLSIRRQKPVLIVPSKPTPYEYKPLSDIDDQQGLRYKLTTLHFYRHDISMTKTSTEGCQVDMAKVIKDAVAKALVFYYPLAGRLREGPNGKLVVECNAEGVQFCEADADARLDHFGDVPQPPFPSEKDLCYDADGPRKMIGCPLVMIQVTRLSCRGFIFAVRNNHTMMDAPGLAQFLQAVTEMARGLDEPNIRPVWAREVLMARVPPYVTHEHPEYQEGLAESKPTVKSGAEQLVRRSIFFKLEDVSALLALLPSYSRTTATKFEVLAACIWRSMSIALYIAGHPDEQVRILVVVNVRGKNISPRLPWGYYGNAFAYGSARSSVSELGSKPLGYAVELVREAKASVTDGYLLSVADLMVLTGRPTVVEESTFVVSDVTNVGFDRLDFGWGKPVYAGWARGALWTGTGVTCGMTRLKNARGEDGVLVPMVMPSTAMEKFAVEIERLKSKEPEEMNNNINAPCPAYPKL